MTLNSTPKILVVEDDADIASSIAERITYEGWEAIVASDGETAITTFNKEHPDAIVLDVMLPKLNGFEVVRIIRAQSTAPIIILTARDDSDDEVKLLELGADDFLAKPLRPSVLAAHLKVWLNRYRSIKTSFEENISTIKIGDFVIDPNTFQATINSRNGKLTPVLTPTEFSMLVMFCTAPDKVFSRRIIMQRIWGWVNDDETRTIDSHIKGLRKKIGAEYIKTVHGIGYKLAPTGRK